MFYVLWIRICIIHKFGHEGVIQLELTYTSIKSDVALMRCYGRSIITSNPHHLDYGNRDFRCFFMAEITPTSQSSRTFISSEFAIFLISYNGHIHFILPKPI